MNTLELGQHLNALIIAGKSEEAFQRFYAEDVVAQDYRLYRAASR